VVVSATAQKVATVQCPNGDILTGGGGRNSTGETLEDHYTMSAPVNSSGELITSGAPTGWRYENANDNNTVIVYAICAS
jgi:hypothetical protein